MLVCGIPRFVVFFFFRILGFPGGASGKNPPANTGDTEDRAQTLIREDPLEENMATLPSTLTWRLPSTEEPGGLQSMGLKVLGMIEQLHTRIP